VKFRFVSLDDLHHGDLPAFLAEHLTAIRSAASEVSAS